MKRANPDRRTAIACKHCDSEFLRTKNSPYCSDRCRFRAKVVAADECQMWQASRTHDGYGSFFIDGRLEAAHRVAYRWTFGPIPLGMDLDHLCRNRACVQPDHLEPVSRRDNILRGAAPTALTFQMNRCKRGHAFTAENTIVKGGDPRKRQCRTCQNEARRARYRKAAA